MYIILIKPLHVYYADWIKRKGIRDLFKLTDSKYPKFLSMGWCVHSRKEIIICKVLNWKLRLKHEIGHEFKLKHTMKKGHVMHPWGIFRGKIIEPSEGSKEAIKSLYDRYEEVLKDEQCV